MSPRVLPLRERAQRNAALPANLGAARRGDERAFMTLYALRAEQAGLCAALALPQQQVGATLVEVFRRLWQTLPECNATQAAEFDSWLLDILSAVVAERRDEEGTATAGRTTGVWDLPAALRTAILLREVFGHPLDDVARALGDPERTVQLWYRNALEELAA